MFDQILKDHTIKKKSLDQQSQNLKSQLKRSSEQLTYDLVLGLNGKVAIIHSNQHVIDKEIKILKKQLDSMQQESQQWLQMYNQLNESMKDLGDLVNWAQFIENDLKELTKS